MTTRLVLIRHGEADCNVRGTWAGHDTCRGLTHRGRSQTAALRDRLVRTGELRGATALLSSAMRRARETAEIIRPAFPNALEVAARCDLCEMHPGELDGIALEIVAGWPGASDPFWAPARGESGLAFARRVSRALRSLARDHSGGLVVAVTHAGVIDGSVLALGTGCLAPGAAPPHTSITEWAADGAPSGWRLVRYGDGGHLDGR